LRRKAAEKSQTQITTSASAPSAARTRARFAPSAQHCGRFFECGVLYAFRDCSSIFAVVQPKLPQITQRYDEKSKTEPLITRMTRINCRAGAPPARLSDRIGRPTAITRSSRSSHVRAGARVDLDRFAFLDEKRDVDGLAGLQLCRLGYVAGGIAAHALRRFDYFQTHRGR